VHRLLNWMRISANTSVTINRMNPSDLCIFYALMTRSNILWKLILVIKRKSLRSWGASKIYPDGGHWTNQLTHVTSAKSNGYWGVSQKRILWVTCGKIRGYPLVAPYSEL